MDEDEERKRTVVGRKRGGEGIIGGEEEGWKPNKGETRKRRRGNDRRGEEKRGRGKETM